jgi:hypothetical protein
MIDPPEDEGTHIVRQDEPPEGLIYSAISGAKSQQPDQEEAVAIRSRFSNLSVFIFVGVFLVLILAVIVASMYLTQPKAPLRSGLIASEMVKKPARPSVAPSIAATTASMVPTAFIPLAPDMLHVTSIALGDVPLAIVNGKRVAEGDWVALPTAAGPVSVQVAKIEDGVVHFDYGQQTIDAKLVAAVATQKSPK